MTCRRPRKAASGERGQALVELAPIVLLMLTMTFAAIDFGRVIWQQEVLTGLTREGSDIASRKTPVNLPYAVNAVVSDGVSLNLPVNGKVIVTTVLNTVVAGKQMYVITDQASSGSYNATSKIGTYVPGGKPLDGKNIANLPVETIPGVVPGVDPAAGNTVFITEVFDSYAPITPLGAFMKHALPTELYDVAYF